MSRDPSGIWMVRSPSPDLERADSGEVLSNAQAVNSSHPEHRPTMATPNDLRHRDYPLIDLERTILSSFPHNNDDKSPPSEPTTSENKTKDAPLVKAQARAQHGSAKSSNLVVPGAVAEISEGPQFKDQARSHGPTAQQRPPSLPHYKDQVRPHQASVPSSEKDARGVVAMHDARARGSATKGSYGPNYKDQARAHPFESQKVIPTPGVHNHAGSEMLSNNPRLEHGLNNQHAVPESDPYLEPGLISAHVVEENDPRTLVQAEAMPGGVFLNRRVTFVAAAMLVVAGCIVGGLCGATDVCSRPAPEPIIQTMAPTTPVPTAPPTPAPTLSDQSVEIVQYIESIRLDSDPINLPILGGRNATPSEQALDWILNEDRLVLSLDNENDKARLRQRFALLTFFFNTSGPSWVLNDKWLEEDDECTWYGITCTDGGMVQIIGSEGVLSSENALSANSLSGTIPADIALLSSVNEMNLYSNPGLKGSLPSALSNMQSLQALRLDNCAFSGSLPESIGEWRNLVSLRLNSNFFTGTLPSSIGLWSYLTWIDISVNLFSGSLPESMGAWSALEYFSAHDNSLTGSLPPSIGNWGALTTFTLNSNKITGSIPASTGSWTNLEIFLVHNNSMTGSLPEECGSWNKISFFQCENNTFTGTLPLSIGNWTEISYFSLGWPSVNSTGTNYFSGTLPDSIGNWNNLLFFSIQDNLFTGTIPESVGNWSLVKDIALSGNELIGSLPASIGNWERLSKFYFWSNRLTGSLPDSIGNWRNIVYFAADTSLQKRTNRFTGTLPSSIGLWTNLELFAIYNSSLTGTLPESIKFMRAITFFDCSMNPISGTIPKAIGENWQGMEVFRVSSTDLTGTIPQSLGLWSSLRKAAFNNTRLEGTMPSGICDIARLESLIADCISEIDCSCCTECF